MQPTTTPWSDTQKILALFLVAAFITIIIVWMFFPPDTNSASTPVLNTLVGTLGGMTTMVVSFYFGSSRNANTKDNTIAALVAPAPTPEHPEPVPHSTPTG